MGAGPLPISAMVLGQGTKARSPVGLPVRLPMAPTAPSAEAGGSDDDFDDELLGQRRRRSMLKWMMKMKRTKRRLPPMAGRAGEGGGHCPRKSRLFFLGGLQKWAG